MLVNDAYTGTVTNTATLEVSTLYTSVQNDISSEAGELGLSLNEAYHTHTERKADSEEDDYAAIDQVEEDTYDYVDSSMMDTEL